MTVTETTGTRQLDPSRSSVEFEVPNLWGLTTVKGRFDRYEGTLKPSGRPAIALTIEAHSLNTKNKRRDEHLRSEDFFDVANHPSVRFEADAADLAGDDLKVRGLLYAGGKHVALEVDAGATPVGEELQIKATALVDQRRLGMTWSTLGVVPAPSKLTVRGRVIRTEDAR
jgi:polyisoprenoid-binding protein YceI